MSKARKRNGASQITDQEMRDHEVVRANREVVAYFKGQRTEREARAALKILKAFVRQREREREKRPLPGRQAAKTPKPTKTKRAKTSRRAHPKWRAMASANETGSSGLVPTPASGPQKRPPEQDE